MAHNNNEKFSTVAQFFLTHSVEQFCGVLLQIIHWSYSWVMRNY